MHTQSIPDIEKQTLTWVRQVVVGLNLCPFANAVVKSDELALFTEPDSQFEPVLTSLIQQCDKLRSASAQSTLLFILPNGFTDFDVYLDLVSTAEALLVDLDFEGVLQIASFHPHYQFEGAAVDDMANYTNRSPYPMLHLLKEAAVERAIEQHPDTQAIPDRNIDLLRSMSLEQLTSLINEEQH